MRIVLVLSLSAVFGCVEPLHAQRPWRAHCLKGDGAQQPPDICLAAAADSLRKRLDTLLAELQRKLPTSRYSQLKVAQGRWSQYLVAHCKWEYGTAQGGTMASIMESGCEADLTADRIAELKVHLCEGEGLTGPCKASRRYDGPSPPPIETRPGRPLLDQ
jgi:uncharacterized protein YecT (DUF1311 family)